MTNRGIRTWIPLLILIGALIVLFLPLIVGDRVLFWGLPSLQFYPWRALAFDLLRNGELPFLNPYNGGGAPLLANYQTAVLYPPNLLYLLLNYVYAMNLLAVLHLFWGGLGMWMLTGGLAISPLGRGVSTLSFALAGYTVARLGSFPTTNAVAWIPWLFWGVLQVVETRKPFYVGLLGIITSLLLLTGHAQTAFYALVAVGLFLLWLVRDVPRGERLKALLMAGGGLLLGVGIGGVQLYLTAELLMASQRSGGVDYETLTNLSFPPLRVFNFLMPNFFGSPADGSYLTPERGVYFEEVVYIGLLPLLAAVAAVTGWLQRRRFLALEQWRAFRTVPLWGILVIVGFTLALGKYGPVYRTLYEFVPTFDSFREPIRWMIWPVFALCVLAGIGVSNWGQSTRLFYWTRLAGAGGAGIALLALAIYQFDTSGQEFIPVLTKAIVAFGCWLAGACLLTLIQPDANLDTSPTRWQIAVLLFVVCDLVWAAQGLNPTAPQEFYREASISEPQARLYWFEDYEQTVKFERYFVLSDYRTATDNWPEIRRSLMPNINLLDRVPLFNNFDPLQPQYYSRYVELIEQQGTQSASLLRAAGVGQVYGETQPEDWEPIEGEYSSFRATSVPSLAWVVPEAFWAESDADLEAAVLSTEWNPLETVILQGEAAPSNQTQVLTSFFEVLEDSPLRKSYRVVDEDGGYLVLAQTWYPGWKVQIDGEAQPLYRANVSFMAVALPPGGGEVTFSYGSTLHPLVIVVAFLSFILSLGFIVIGLMRQS
jgi:hypothetical protein